MNESDHHDARFNRRGFLAGAAVGIIGAMGQDSPARDAAPAASLNNDAAGAQLTPRTTLTVLVTNRKLDGDTLRQIARQAHASMSRAIEPFHTVTDGDVFFAATTGQVMAEQPNAYRIGMIASELAWDAVLCCYDS